MSAEHTPLNMEQDGTAAYIGPMTLDGQMLNLYEEPADLPCSPEKRAICERHFDFGATAEMLDDLLDNHCDLQKAHEEGRVRIQFSCGGPSEVLQHCNLVLTQYDSEGNKLSVGLFKQKPHYFKELTKLMLGYNPRV